VGEVVERGISLLQYARQDLVIGQILYRLYELIEIALL